MHLELCKVSQRQDRPERERGTQAEMLMGEESLMHPARPDPREAFDTKEIFAGMNVMDTLCDPNHHLGPVSGEVARIRVELNATETVSGHLCPAQSNHSLVDLQNSPSYNGHKFNIELDRDNDASTSQVHRNSHQMANQKVFIRKVG